MRVRIGVGKPPSKERGADHVLSRLPPGRSASCSTWRSSEAADAVELIVAEGVDAAMRHRFNGRRLRPAVGDARTRRRTGRRTAAPASEAAHDVVLDPHAPRVLPPAARRTGAHPGARRPDAASSPSPRPARAVTHRRPRPADRPPPARRRLPDRHRRRPAVRRPPPVHARRRGGAVPGVGDAAVRAGQPERRDDGPSPRGAVAAAHPERVPGRSSSPASAPCCSSSGPAATTIEPIRVARATARPRRAAAPLVEHRLPPRGARRAPRRGRPARRDRRRLPVDGRRADPHRPVGRRGRPAHRRSASTTSAAPPTSPRR